MNCADDLTSIDLSSTVSSTLTSSTISLFPYILHAQSTGLNLTDPSHLPRLLRPLDSKDVVLSNDEIVGTASETQSGGTWTAGCVDSQEGDDEIIIHVRFSELVRIKSILIGTGGGQSPISPRRVKVWTNRVDGIDFDMIEEGVKPEQEWELLESDGEGGRGAVEYPVRIARFNNVMAVDLAFSESRSHTQSRLFYLGFMGEARQLKKEPGDKMMVGAENGVMRQIDGVKEESRGSESVK